MLNPLNTAKCRIILTCSMVFSSSCVVSTAFLAVRPRNVAGLALNEMPSDRKKAVLTAFLKINVKP